MHALGNPVPWRWVSVYSGPDDLVGLHLKVGSVANLLVWMCDRHGAVDSASLPAGLMKKQIY
jgi:hypothetical protein